MPAPPATDLIHEHEAIVLGAGPAGCAAATLLARRSHEVALVRPASTPAGALAESIPPSARRLLSELGLLDEVERAGFIANGGNTVWWADGEARSEVFPEGQHGFHVDRASFERVLVRAAESMGVRVYHETVARRAAGPHRPSAGGGGTREDRGRGPIWHVDCEGHRGASLRLTAPWIVDATGRHGLLARESRRPDRATTTTALIRRWRGAAPDGALATHTLIESYREGWAWSVPLAGGDRCVTAMVDPRLGDLTGDIDAMLDAELARTVHLAAALAGAEPVESAWACPASLHTSERFARPGLLLAGDAGSFIDPLSSYGVKKALSSGWLAGVVVHTALVDSPMTETALAFFDAREREVYRSYRALSATFFEEAARAYDHPYWADRADAARAAGAEAAVRDDPDRLLPRSVPEEDVRAAFDAIRGRTRLHAVPGPTLGRFEGAAVEGYRIVLEEHLASDAYPDGMRFVRGVDLRRLVEVAPRHQEVPDGWSAYNGVATPVTLPDYLTALSTAFAAGFLAHRDG